MKADQNLLNQLKNMDDATLKEAIGAVTQAMGMDARQQSRALGHIRIVRSKLNRATEKDLQQAMDQLRDDKVQELRRRLGL